VAEARGLEGLNYTAPMEDLDREEYRALRATIAARGSLRSVLALASVAAWAGALIAVLVWLPYPMASLIPLLVLVGGFEAIRPLHFGAERIGRYLQVFHEEGATPPALGEPPSWERVAMVFGKTPGAAGHPLFAPVFGLAALTNFLAVILPGPVAIELGALAVPHVAFLGWLVATDRLVRAQRAADLARFRALRDLRA
jgi:hypothetical protein